MQHHYASVLDDGISRFAASRRRESGRGNSEHRIRFSCHAIPEPAIERCQEVNEERASLRRLIIAADLFVSFDDL